MGADARKQNKNIPPQAFKGRRTQYSMIWGMLGDEMVLGCRVHKQEVYT